MRLTGSHPRGRGRARPAAKLAVVVALALVLVITGAASGRSGSAVQARACRAPRLTGLVLSVARERAEKSGCRLRLMGAAIDRASVQTIRRQSPGAGMHGRTVTVWVNPLCAGSALLPPPGGEPILTPGPTELVSGLYLDGGPLRFRSAPRCASLVGEPGPGTITVTNPMTGATVASATVANDHLARIPLPAGTYELTGTFAGSTINGQPAQSFPVTVHIPVGRTVRLDVVLNVP